MSNTARSSREQETRAAEELHDAYSDSWEASGMLDTSNIPAREGYDQRWVRTKTRNEDDQSNVFKKINQGWRPRQADTVPKGQYIPQIEFNGSNVIGIHGNILMERPKAIGDKQRAFIRKQSEAQMRSVQENMFKVHTPGSGLVAPSMTNDTRVTKGRLVEADD
jgi:hypothetical protein